MAIFSKFIKENTTLYKKVQKILNFVSILSFSSGSEYLSNQFPLVD